MGERLAAHDAALRLAAGTRVRVWRALARQGLAADRTPGAALARAVGDVGLLQDLSVRSSPPPVVAAATALGGLRAAGPGVAAGRGRGLVVLLATAAVVAVLHRRVDAEAARAEADLRVRALQEAAAVPRGRGGPARARPGDVGRPPGAGTGSTQRTAAAGAVRPPPAAERAVVAGTGPGRGHRCRAGLGLGVSGPVLAVLALAPLASPSR